MLFASPPGICSSPYSQPVSVPTEVTNKDSPVLSHFSAQQHSTRVTVPSFSHRSGLFATMTPLSRVSSCLPGSSLSLLAFSFPPSFSVGMLLPWVLSTSLSLPLLPQ